MYVLKKNNPAESTTTLLRNHFLIYGGDLIASRIPPGHVNWVVGGCVVFCPCCLLVFSVRPHFLWKWGPEGPKMRPRGTPNGSQNREKSDLGPKMAPRNYKKVFRPMVTTPWGGFLGPQGTPKSTKNATLGGNGGPSAVIFSIFAEKGAATHFFIDFSSIFD